MNFFDLHCDTLYEIYNRNQGLYENKCHVSLKKSSNIQNYIGCFAIWMPDKYRGIEAVKFFDLVYKKLADEKEKNDSLLKFIDSAFDMGDVSISKKGLILTVEGGSVLAGELERIRYLKSCGVKMITLTWNGSNEIGDGSGVENPRGLTEFGIKAVKEMENQGIIVDVSHASERLFYDVSEIAKKPFIASHANSYSVCKHCRNLTDEQFNLIKENGGLVGITFCKKFLNFNKDASFSDIMKHIEHFLALSGGEVLAIGSDFDGADMPDGIDGLNSMETLYEYLLRHNYSEELVQKIFYKNSYNFFKKMI